MDNKQQVGTPDRDRVNVNELYELAYWAKELRVQPEDLKSAVKSVGTSVEALRKHFNK